MNTLFLTGNGYCLPRNFTVDGKNNTVYWARKGLHFPQRFLLVITELLMFGKRDEDPFAQAVMSGNQGKKTL